MDIKESNMLKHYKQLIENREFDEYDIYAFLILIRDHIPKGKLKIFRDFADAVAHREKNKGIMVDNIKNCIINNYQKSNGAKVKDYTSFSIKSWNNQLKQLMNIFDIKTNKIIIKELTVCIFSIFQNLILKDKNDNILGEIVMLANHTCNEIYLCTSEIDNDFSKVCFIKQNNIIISQELLEIMKYSPAEAIREDRILKLKNRKGIFCEIN